MSTPYAWLCFAPIVLASLSFPTNRLVIRMQVFSSGTRVHASSHLEVTRRSFRRIPRARVSRRRVSGYAGCLPVPADRRENVTGRQASTVIPLSADNGRDENSAWLRDCTGVFQR